MPLPIIAHTLNVLLQLLESEESETQVSAMQTLRELINNYLNSKDFMPQFLPGTVSTLCKVLLGSNGNSRIIVEVLKCLQLAIEGALSEERCGGLGLYNGSFNEAENAISLEGLFASSPTISDDLTSVPDGQSTPNRPGASHAWLRATASQLHRAFLSVLPVLQGHENALVRAGFSSFSLCLLQKCQKSLMQNSRRLLLEELLVLCQDDWESVSIFTRAQVDLLLQSNANIRNETEKVAEDYLMSLPQSIFSFGITKESTLERQLNLIISAFSRSTGIAVGNLKIEKWSRTLLRALELEPMLDNAATSARQNTATAWLQPNQTFLLLDQWDTDGSEKLKRLPSFPAVKFVHLAPGTSVRLVKRAIRTVAAVTVSAGFTGLLEHFLELLNTLDSGKADEAMAASALWVTAQILKAYSEKPCSLSEERKKRLGRDVVSLANSWLDHTLDDNDRPEGSVSVPIPEHLSDNTEDDNVQAVQLRKGFTQIDNLLGADAPSIPVSPLRQQRLPSHIPYTKAMSIRLLSECANLLGPAFRRYMLEVLYPLLRALSASTIHLHGLIQAYAYCALHRISFHASYSSSAEMIIQNVDYILNSVSSNLRAATGIYAGALDPLAPSVLVCVVDLAGDGVLPFLGDAVEEIFDALDRWHAYDLLVSELLRVLDKLVSVAKQMPLQQHELTSGPVQAALQPQPDRERDLQEFEEWFRDRHEASVTPRMRMEDTTHEDGLPDTNPQQPYGDLPVETAGNDRAQDGQEEDEGEDGLPVDEDDGPPITRSQGLVLSILRKCLYFLTHSSPFLRARVLSLLTSSIPILQTRSSDLLPEIHRFWPYILARLTDGFEGSPVYVLLECMKLISTLMEYKGDFMNLRIIRDVWPRLRKMLASLQPSAGHGRPDQFSPQHRILQSAVSTMRMAVNRVPGIKNEDLWDIAMVFRAFLSSSADNALQHEARMLFEQLAKIEPDMLWLVLNGGAGQVEGMVCLSSPVITCEDDAVKMLLRCL